jgi:hypothetical protein
MHFPNNPACTQGQVPSRHTVADPSVTGLSALPITVYFTAYGLLHRGYRMQTLLAPASAGGLLWHF